MTCCKAALYNDLMTVETDFWRTQANYDLTVAELLYQQGVYRYCVFFRHLALEKRLKGILLERTGLTESPHSHRLLNLARRVGVNLPPSYHEFLRELTEYSTAARYPKPQELVDYNRDMAERILDQTREVYEWLNSRTAS